MSAGSADHGRLREKSPTTYYDGAVKLPGYGEAPNRCRPMSPVGFCEEGHTLLGRSSCGTRYCPDHWRDWVEDAVISMVERLAAYRHARDGAEKRLSHVVASPPQERRYGRRAMWDTRSDAYDALRDAGVRGGTVVTHPYRTTDEADEMYRAVATEGDLDEDTGKWAWLRDATDGWDELTQYIEASPHYHALAAAEDVDGSDAPDGWVVERIRSLSAFHLYDSDCYEDMAAVAYYVLTHGAVQGGSGTETKATTTYFGEIHPATFRPEEELTTAAWRRIQKEAEAAVKGRDGFEEEGEGSGHGPEECPRDGCDACVVDVLYLPEYLRDDDWVAKVRSHRDGRKRWLRLRGMVVWWEEGSDRPPPATQAREHRLLEWLEATGEQIAGRPSQVSLSAAVMGE